MQVCPYLFYLYDPGVEDPWAVEGIEAGLKAVFEVPSMGRKWF